MTGLLSAELSEKTHATVEVHHVSMRFLNFRSLRPPPKTDLERKIKSATG